MLGHQCIQSFALLQRPSIRAGPFRVAPDQLIRAEARDVARQKTQGQGAVALRDILCVHLSLVRWQPFCSTVCLGMGLLIIRTLLAEHPELAIPTHKQIAVLVGVAPLYHESGTLWGRRHV